MKRDTIIRIMKELGPGVCLGTSGALVLHGVMEDANDLDVVATTAAFKRLTHQYRATVTTSQMGDPRIELHLHGEKVEIFNVPFSQVILIDGVLVETINVLKAFYRRRGRPKDHDKLRLIAEYYATK